MSDRAPFKTWVWGPTACANRARTVSESEPKAPAMRPIGRRPPVSVPSGGPASAETRARGLAKAVASAIGCGGLRGKARTVVSDDAVDGRGALGAIRFLTD